MLTSSESTKAFALALSRITYTIKALAMRRQHRRGEQTPLADFLFKSCARRRQSPILLCFRSLGHGVGHGRRNARPVCNITSGRASTSCPRRQERCFATGDRQFRALIYRGGKSDHLPPFTSRRPMKVTSSMLSDSLFTPQRRRASFAGTSFCIIQMRCQGSLWRRSLCRRPDLLTVGP